MTGDPRSQPSSAGLLERLKEESLQLQRRSFDSADAGMSANLCDEAIDRIQELEGALRPFAQTGWMTHEIEHTARTVVAHMHPEREREIILSSENFKLARDLLQPKAGS